MGTANRDRLAYANQMEAYTGGISFAPHVSFNPRGWLPSFVPFHLHFFPHNPPFFSLHTELNSFNAGISVSSCALDQHTDKMFDLILDPLLNFSTKEADHFQNLIRMSNSSMLGTLASSGHQFAMTYSSSFFGPGFVSSIQLLLLFFCSASVLVSDATQSLKTVQKLSETFDGSTQMHFLEATEKKDPQETLRHLVAISEALKKGISLKTFIVSESGSLQSAERIVDRFGDSLPVHHPAPGFQTESFSAPATNTYFSTPLLIHHVGKSLLTVPYNHPDSPALAVLARLMTNGFLHREVREKNGAYGGGANFSSLTGVFNFMSYRDPASPTHSPPSPTLWTGFSTTSSRALILRRRSSPSSPPLTALLSLGLGVLTFLRLESLRN